MLLHKKLERLFAAPRHRHLRKLQDASRVTGSPPGPPCPVNFFCTEIVLDHQFDVRSAVVRLLVGVRVVWCLLPVNICQMYPPGTLVRRRLSGDRKGLSGGGTRASSNLAFEKQGTVD